MSRLILFISAILLSASRAFAISTLPIEGVLEIPNGEPASNYQITLNGGEYSTLSRQDGSFVFFDIPSGIYALDVLSIKYAFPQVKIKVDTELANGGPSIAETSTADAGVNGDSQPMETGNYTVGIHKHSQAISVVEYKYPGAARIPAGK